MRSVLAALLLSVAAAGALTVAEVRNPRPRGSWVADEANVLTPAEVASIDARLDALKASTGAEVAVVTVPDTSGEETKQFATELFNHWGIGQKGRDNGVLVLLNMAQRRLEIETGYGAEAVLPDGKVGDILRTRMLPKFKAGEFGQGIIGGLEEIDQALRSSGETPTGGDDLPVTAMSPSGPLASGVVGKSLPWFGGFAVLALAAGWTIGWRSRPRCPTDGLVMRKLGDREEDEYLDDLQELEEELGGVRWSIWQCPQCQHIIHKRVEHPRPDVERCPECDRVTLAVRRPDACTQEKECRNPACGYQRMFKQVDQVKEGPYLDQLQQLEQTLGGIDYKVWICEATGEVSLERKERFFSSIADCPSCQRRTLRRRTWTLRHATSYSNGIQRTEEECLNPECRYHDIRDRVLPRHVSSSSGGFSSGSSGGGGGSFGGGSSGGGGGGGNW
ncbi:MAG: TPM domain-containing protein [Armatimonadetes bacterium]|nr:TPM domain-containing protein [Armatimonadota bacterium]